MGENPGRPSVALGSQGMQVELWEHSWQQCGVGFRESQVRG